MCVCVCACMHAWLRVCVHVHVCVCAGVCMQCKIKQLLIYSHCFILDVSDPGSACFIHHWFGFTGPYATFSFSSNFWSCFTGPYATFCSSSIFWLCSESTSSYTAAVCCCSCVFGTGLELRLFLFHLLMQTVSNAPHTAPAMNTTSEQTTAEMATAVAVERRFSGVGVRINCILYCINKKGIHKAAS